MGKGVTFATGVLDEIVARSGHDGHEVCGLLLGKPDHVGGVLHCANVAPDPSRSFEIEPRQLLAAHKAARAGGPAIVGCYHSHPGGSGMPSERDAESACDDGAIWLIVGVGGALVWRATAGGAVHGRFDPLRITIRG